MDGLTDTDTTIIAALVECGADHELGAVLGREAAYVTRAGIGGSDAVLRISQHVRAEALRAARALALEAPSAIEAAAFDSGLDEQELAEARWHRIAQWFLEHRSERLLDGADAEINDDLRRDRLTDGQSVDARRTARFAMITHVVRPTTVWSAA